MGFSASRAFSEAFRLLTGRFLMMAGIWLLFFVGIVAVFAAFGGVFLSMMRLSGAAAGGGGFVPGRSMFAGMGASVFLFYVLYFLVIFAQQIAISRASTGRPEDTFAVSLGSGLRGALPMFGVMLIYLIVGIGGGFVLSLLFAAVVAAAQSALVSLVLAIAMFVLIFYMFARLSLVLPIVGIGEIRNPISVVGTAWRLTKGHSLKIMLSWGVVLIALGLLYFLAMGLTVGLPSPGNAAAMSGSIGFFAVMVLLGLTGGLYMITLTTAFYDQLSPTSIEATAETFA